MKKIIKSSDGKIYFNVTDKAEALFHSKAFDLYAVWEKAGSTLRIPIFEKQELDYALANEKTICIEIASLEDLINLIPLKPEKWEQADKILNNGYIYIRYADLF